MVWNIGYKLYRDSKFIDLFGENLIGKPMQALWGDCYVLEADLGGGGWSDTWRASRQGEQYAVKTPKSRFLTHPDYESDRGMYLTYIDQEAKALAACEHPHIVKIIEKLLLPLEDNRPCIVMEYIEGKTLWQWVKQHKHLPELEALKYVEQIGNALTMVHRNDFLHHDVKPHNIMIRDPKTTGGECQAVLIDFGVARQFIPELIRSYSHVPGTFGFSPPELESARIDMQRLRLAGSKETIHVTQTERIDVYSLAATLYYMVTGKHPQDLPLEMPPERISEPVRLAITAGMSQNPDLRPVTIREWLLMLPLNFRNVYRIDGKVFDYDPANSNAPTWDGMQHKFSTTRQKREAVEQVQKEREQKEKRQQREALQYLQSQRREVKFQQLNILDLGNGVTLELVKVPVGKFIMGSNERDSEKPIHEVHLQEFLMGKYTVTQKQWQAVMGNNPSNFKGEDLPVERVSWTDARQFCQKLSQQTGREIRLPTEAEWEYAARGANQSQNYTYAGSNDINEVAWYAENSDSRTHAVGQKKPNEIGLYDMSGNVWEWCADDWHDNYEGAPADSQIWIKDIKNYEAAEAPKLIRGGSWFNVAQTCHSAYRNRHGLRALGNDSGFRVVYLVR